MAKKFRGPEIVKEIDEALNKGLARFLTNTQSKLSAATPVANGRLASSWFIGKGVPDRSVAPERDKPGPVVVTNTTERSRWIPTGGSRTTCPTRNGWRLIRCMPRVAELGGLIGTPGLKTAWTRTPSGRSIIS